MIPTPASHGDAPTPLDSHRYHVPILGTEVLVICSADRSYVPLGSFCEALGLDRAAQHEAQTGFGWFEPFELTWTDRTGICHTDEVICRNSIFSWLSVLDPKDVRPILRERLEAYQVKIAEILGADASLKAKAVDLLGGSSSLVS